MLGARGWGTGSEELGCNDCGVPAGKMKVLDVHRVNALSATESCPCQWSRWSVHVQKEVVVGFDLRGVSPGPRRCHGLVL